MESPNNIKNWGISIEQEREFLDKSLINILIPIPKNCNLSKRYYIFKKKRQPYKPIFR